MLNLLHESGVLAFKGNPYLICFASILLLHDVMGIIEEFLRCGLTFYFQ